MTEFSSQVRTVSSMLDSHLGAVRGPCLHDDVLTLDAHLAAAARLADVLWCHPPDVSCADACVEAEFELDDVIEVVVGAAFVSMQQLQIALRLTLESAQRTQLVLRIVERACASGATPAAVGASALLLETVRHDGLGHAVTVAADAASVLGNRELLDGSAALVASLSVEIAELLDISPAAVSSEIVRLVAALPSRQLPPTHETRRIVELAVCG